MQRLISAALILAACTACGGNSSNSYGFVTVLGHDTVAVERIARTPGALVSDEVDKWPSVKIRHTVLSLAPDGTIPHLEMGVRTPNGATPKARWRHVTADVTKDSVKISIRDSSGVKDTAFATGGAITVPHVSMMYSVIEQEIAAAITRGNANHIAAGDSVHFRQWYPDRDIGESFVLHEGWVHPLGGGKVELWHDWLSGIADVVVDTSRQMLSYNGARSTYKVLVSRVALADVPDIQQFGAKLAAAEKASGGIKQLSVRDTARGTIGTATIAVDYGRPLARGRELLGKVIEYDYVWRTGANAATQFTTSVSDHARWNSVAGRDVHVVDRAACEWRGRFDREQGVRAVGHRLRQRARPGHQDTPDGDRDETGGGIHDLGGSRRCASRVARDGMGNVSVERPDCSEVRQ